jgi:adenosine deaminase
MGEEMTSSGIGHVDLRVGVIMRRWPWIASLADAIETFRAELPGPDTLNVSFLGAVNLSKPHHLLDTVFGRIMEDARTAGLLTGLDINMQPADLATLDRYLTPLRDLQRSGLRINIHLGELFGARFSRHVLSRIIPTRIGHGVLLLDDAETVQLIREHQICLDMCPVSNTRLVPMLGS